MRRDLRNIIARLDAALDDYDASANGAALTKTLDDIANASDNTDPAFAKRVKQVATRVVKSDTPTERDIASVLARDVRRDLMCLAGREQASRTTCTPDAETAQNLSASPDFEVLIKHLGS